MFCENGLLLSCDEKIHVYLIVLQIPELPNLLCFRASPKPCEAWDLLPCIYERYISEMRFLEIYIIVKFIMSTELVWMSFLVF